jgi:penicillin-binding protein 2
MRRHATINFLRIAVAVVLAAGVALAAPAHRRQQPKKLPVAAKNRTARTGVSGKNTPAALTRSTARVARRSRRSVYSPWTVPTYAESAAGDRVDGEDLQVRRAAVDALGPYNGSVVAVDPRSGRILTMVNQKLALKSGFQPCSTVKIPVALAALSEGLVDKATPVRLYGRTRMDLTQALAHSNNYYFANLGIKLGYERFSYYAKLFGLGERAGLNIAGEEPGYFADAPPKNGGMGMMTSFGEGITVTPLELAALLSAVSNGGTLYYLQYPESAAEIDGFLPRVKRQLEIADYIPQIKPGMMGAVEFGTARRALYNPEAPVCGKTGTCTGGTTHLGWFGSFSEFGQNRVVVVVLLTGGPGVSGPTAAQISGSIYRRLQQEGYFDRKPVFSPAMLVPR